MKKVIITIIILLIIGGSVYFVLNIKDNKTIDFDNASIEEIEKYAKDKKLKLTVEKIYSKEVIEGKVISHELKDNKLKVIISLGKIPLTFYKDNHINELGKIPIMMYHGIVNKKNSETNFTGGNVDKDGYNRTTEAFINDLEFYYKNNYRMISLKDYVNKKINIPLGKSPIVLTFDDGKENNMKVLKKDDKGNLEIDPNCAVGILESFKKKYPDYNVTATFFLNSSLFNQKEYNKDIIKWLIKNNYDIGNHTLTHPDISKITKEETNRQVGGMYKILDDYLKDYVKIVALPFGSPYKKSHPNFNSVLEGNINDYKYNTTTTLRVGWDSEYSPFDTYFDYTFLKRIRAWDNNGKDFDITYVFKNLENNKYISDGDEKTIVVPLINKDRLIDTKLEVITY